MYVYMYKTSNILEKMVLAGNDTRGKQCELAIEKTFISKAFYHQKTVC